MKDAKLLLESLTERIPPSAPHRLWLVDGGSIEICLFLFDGKVLPITLEPSDFEMPINELVDQIVFLEEQARTNPT